MLTSGFNVNGHTDLKILLFLEGGGGGGGSCFTGPTLSYLLCIQVKKEDAKLYDIVVFDGPIPTEQVLWKTHCVQNTEGAALYGDLKVGMHYRY